MKRKVCGYNVAKIGNGYFSLESEYLVHHSHSGYQVVRGDGSYAEFLDSDEAHEAARNLASGEASDSDFDWCG